MLKERLKGLLGDLNIMLTAESDRKQQAVEYFATIKTLKKDVDQPETENKIRQLLTELKQLDTDLYTISVDISSNLSLVKEVYTLASVSEDLSDLTEEEKEIIEISKTIPAQMWIIVDGKLEVHNEQKQARDKYMLTIEQQYLKADIKSIVATEAFN